MKFLLQLLILTTGHIIQVAGVLEWTVIGKVTDYGQNVTLFCNVSNCCPKYAGWDRWTPVQQTLFIDVKTGRANKKYDGKVLSDGYTLIIKNLTKKDLNVSYSCLYDTTFGERKFLLAEDVFTYISYTPPLIPPPSGLSSGEIAGILLGIVVVSLAVPVFCFVIILRRQRKKNEDNTAVNQYLKELKSGKEIRRHVRIHVIGQDKVGKSSLVRRLIGKEMGKTKSTDGLDIVKECQIDTTNGKWITGSGETENQKIVRRLQQALNRKPSYNGLLTSEDSSISTENKQLIPEEHIDSTQPLLSNVAYHKNNKELVTTESSINVVVAQNVSSNDKPIDERHSSSGTPRKHSKIPAETFDLFGNQNSKSITSKTITDTLIKILKDNHEEIEKTSADLVECDIWDFAGQKDYYATHQTFFSPHAIYILVADIQKDLKFYECDAEFSFDTSGEYIDYWFESVHCFCKDDKSSKLHPPVIIVCTKTDELKDEDKKRIKTYQSNFNAIFGKRKWVNHCRGFHFISNLQSSNADIESLQNAISQIAKEMNYFPEKLPVSWIKLEKAFQILRNLDHPVYTLEAITKLAHEHSIKDKRHLFDFLTYQHKIGNIIFFQDESDFVIVKPKWLIQCFRCLVCDEDKKTYKDVLPSEMFKLTSYGELSDAIIDNLFTKESDVEFGKYKQYILNLMVKFDIIVKPKCIESQNTSYYMPCMINNTSTLEQIIANNSKFTNIPRTPWLVLEFQFLPIAYFNHIMFNFIRKYKVCDVKSKVANVDCPALFAGKAVVYLDDEQTSRLLVICFSKNAISLQIWKWKDVQQNTYKEILFDLCNDIEDLERKLKHNLHYEIKAKCSTGEYSSRCNRISYEFLSTHSKDRTYHCEEHPASDHTTVEIKNTWFRHVPTVKQELTERMKKRAEQDAVIQNDSFDQYDEVRYHPVQPKESNGIDNQGTNIANRFGHHPSNEEPIVDIETSGTPRTSFQPLIATSFARIDTCKSPQPQQSDDEDKETSHAARSVVSSQQEEVVLPDNDSHISNPNQEEDIVIISSKFPAYSKKRVREQSFVEWYLSEPSKQKMASAGFFYKGCNTYAQCFCCGFNQTWTENDDPFSSSLHNDNCSYSEKVNNSSVQDSNSRSPDNEETNPKSME